MSQELQNRILEFHKVVCRQVSKLETVAGTVDVIIVGLQADNMPNTASQLKKQYDEIVRIIESIGVASTAMAKPTD